MLAEELAILDADVPSWLPLRPLLDAALRLEQHDETYIWHGWQKRQINAFLQRLPAHCALLLGVWETRREEEDEKLVLGCVCEVSEGEIRSIRTLEALSGLADVQELQPGFEHAFALLKAIKAQVAAVAWALFTDKTTWDEWLFSEGTDGSALDKGELLAQFARQGRCVLLGSQTEHLHP